MSCDNWEKGTIKLSVAEFTKFKKAFREGFNRMQNKKLEAAIECLNKYRTGKLPTWESDRDAYIEMQDSQGMYPKIWGKFIHSDIHSKNWGHWEQRKRPRKPIRKDFPLANNKQTLFYFSDHEGGIEFNNKTREVEYQSGHNNRQVERARESEGGKLFFRLLNDITWIKGTGGKLIGNDEHNSESETEGGGGCYVTEEYGPKMQRRTRFMTRY